MSTLGDPLTDVGALLMYWEMMTHGQGMFGAVPDGARFPAADVLVDHYLSAGGADLDHLAWYLAFANFKLAVIAEGIHYRYRAGQTVGEGFEKLGAGVPLLVARGHEILSEA